MIRSLCLFCGARNGENPLYRAEAIRSGELLADQQITLVFGGGHVGLMGAAADAVLAKGGRVTGVIPQSLVDREVAHSGLTTLHITQTMHERKALMANISDAFVALPGGFGTLDELCEIITWAQLGIHQKRIFVLNTARYFDGFLHFVKTAIEEGFIPLENLDLLEICSTPEEVVKKITVG
jgi:hypothetical protein